MIQKFHSKKGGFTLVEIMIVVAIIALLAAIAVPSFLRARTRSQASTVLNDLRLIDAAKDQYMIENNRSSVASFTAAMLSPYLKAGSDLQNSLGGGSATDRAGGSTIVYEGSNTLPSVTHSFDSDVVPDEFWSPYGVN